MCIMMGRKVEAGTDYVLIHERRNPFSGVNRRVNDLGFG